MIPEQHNPQQVIDAIAEHYSAILRLIGEDPGRDGLVKTPQRAAKALYYATQGYRQDPHAVMSQAIFEYAGSRLITVRDIEFYSLCEHHMLPFYGHISIGYIPDGNMIGLSKLARLVEVFARRLQVQERLTSQICQQVMQTLHAKGAIVQCRAHHLCMKMRGVEKQDSTTVTVDYAGEFAESPVLVDQFLRSLKD